MSIKQKLFIFFKPNLVKVVVFLLLGIFWWWMIDNSFFIDFDMPSNQQGHMRMTNYEFLDNIINAIDLLLLTPAFLIYIFLDFELNEFMAVLASYIYIYLVSAFLYHLGKFILAKMQLFLKKS